MIFTASQLVAPLLLSAVCLPIQEGATAVLEAPAASNLQRALDTISADEIRSDLYFIASDAMMGRDSPSPQLKIAARYIRGRLMRFGFEPGAQEGSYFYEWSYPQLGLDMSKTYLKVAGPGAMSMDLKIGEDYFLSQRAYGMRTATGPAVWGGTFSKGELEGIDPTGKWILGVNDEGLSGRRTRDLEEGGALGVIVLPGKKNTKPVAEEYARDTEVMSRTSLNRRGGDGRATFPIVHVSEKTARALVAALPEDLAIGGATGLSFDESCGRGKVADAVMENVCGIWPGSDPELRKEVIILSAHYDHVGAQADGAIFNGADDNGSGTCGLLAIAEALKEYGPMRRTIMLMWVSAEEKGLLGSEAWCKAPYLPEGLTALCNINIDMIGRNAGNELLITPTKDHEAYSALTQVVEANAESEGFTKVGSADAYYGRSDQYNFEKHMGLPVAFLFCDVHEDYHRPTDTPDKINYDKMRRICRLVVKMLEALQIDRPKF
ncbi:Aminopeptidase S [Planctomycetes bacterium Poly30]|uniref:Aminopeptidase S n=1 Tax=Saltatorellus ferox TaxID=2528018 RepID=A0A518EPJ1_9BACT|nr:Aminopeptidase S [Planctomycetes bacterium Poly30]